MIWIYKFYCIKTKYSLLNQVFVYQPIPPKSQMTYNVSKH